MDRNEKYEKCKDYFDRLANKLSETHIVVGSCNQDKSAYLVPKGTEAEITYHSKPINSYRISDHWNWKTNVRKNPDDKYIQCYTQDMPWTKKREAPGKASKPIWGIAVCYFDEMDHMYHVIYGEKFDRKTRTWSWVENEE